MPNTIPASEADQPHAIPPTRSALLRHTLPDRSAHFDWLIERPATTDGISPEHRMLTFRCETDPRDAARQSAPDWVGTRLPDHRAHYLDYEGPVSGNRGTVRRVWRAPCQLLETTDTQIRVLLWAPTGHNPAETVPSPITLRHAESDRWIMVETEPASGFVSATDSDSD